MLTGIGAVNGFFIVGQRTSPAMYPSKLFPAKCVATAMTAVFNTRRVIAAIASLAGAVVIQTFGSVSRVAVVIGSIDLFGCSVTLWIGPETPAKPLLGAHDLAGPPSRSHIFAAE